MKTKELKGYSASPGITSGQVCLYSQEVSEIPHYGISVKQIENELKRLENAYAEAALSLARMEKVSLELFGEQGKDIIVAHRAILNDPGLRKKIEKRIKDKHINAEHAVEDSFESYITILEEKGLHFEEISHDVKDVRDRLIESFGHGGGKFSCPVGEKAAVVVAADSLTPSMILNVPKENVLAFVTRRGGYTSHATIIARSLNVPVIFGIDVEQELTCQAYVIVDGTLGKVYVNPDKKTKDFYKNKKKLLEERKKVCGKALLKPSKTAEGKKITLKVNISIIGELELLKAYKTADNNGVHYDGIGLLRTEFIFMNSASAPGENEQVAIYKMVLDSVPEKPVVMRMLDPAPDKLPAYMKAAVQNHNEIRGARAVVAYKDIFLSQARAMLRTAIYGDLKILFPMIADVQDINTYINLIDKAEESLKKEGVESRRPSLGIMYETPSSILLADELLEKVDFANIGTNDLLQYSIATSRESNNIQERYHMMHPSIIKMIGIVAAAGRKHGKEICLCGEIGAFEQYYPVLLDVGVSSFSVPAAKYEDIKCELLHLSRVDYDDKAKKYLKKMTYKSQERFFNKTSESS
jgi:phosphotransferase system enzyme I (PtsI)